MKPSDPSRYDLVKQEARTLALADRLAFLQGIRQKNLYEGSLLDLHHQSILRILREEDPEKSRDTVMTYVQHPEKRVEYLAQALASTQKSNVQNAPAYEEIDSALIRGGYSFTSQYAAEVAMNSDAYEEKIRELDPAAVTFVSPLGFGFFPGQAIKTLSYKNNKIVDCSEYTSVGGMMYYAFNNGSGQASCIQKHSIDVLAYTLGSHIFCSGPQDALSSEMQAYAAESENWEKVILQDTTTFILAHEEGHDPEFEGNKLLFELMDQESIQADNFYRTDFPSRNDLQAWSRIKAGVGTPKDTLFLLGDFLANMAILENGMEKGPKKLLQAFNWWLVREPTERSRPRGLATFLAHSYDYDRQSHINDLSRIFETAACQPSKLAQELRLFERRGWERLQTIAQSHGLKEFRPC